MAFQIYEQNLGISAKCFSLLENEMPDEKLKVTTRLIRDVDATRGEKFRFIFFEFVWRDEKRGDRKLLGKSLGVSVSYLIFIGDRNLRFSMEEVSPEKKHKKKKKYEYEEKIEEEKTEQEGAKYRNFSWVLLKKLQSKNISQPCLTMCLEALMRSHDNSLFCTQIYRRNNVSLFFHFASSSCSSFMRAATRKMLSTCLHLFRINLSLRDYKASSS